MAVENANNLEEKILQVMCVIGVLGFPTFVAGLVVEINDAFTNVQFPNGEIVIISGLVGSVIGLIAECRRRVLMRRDANLAKNALREG